MILPVMAAILALAGAPANTQVVCDPNLAQDFPALPGYETAGIAEGIGTDHPVILLGPTTCGAILYLSMTPAERYATHLLNQTVSWDWLEGAGLLIAMHESEHEALRSWNECDVERQAIAKVPEIIARYADDAGALRMAEAADSSMPINYHTGCAS